MRKMLAAAIAALTLPAAASAAPIITNGSFEQATLTNLPAFVTLGTGSTVINGWTVTGGSVDYIISYWPGQSGTRSIDLSGNSAGRIAQTINTTAGQRYVATFFLGGNFDGPPPSKSVRVTFGGQSRDFTYTPPIGHGSFAGYAPFRFSFTGTGGPTALSFESLANTSYGAALDSVSVSVPEPASWALLILGFGFAGATLRRRRAGVLAAA